ncbi:MAG: hypothetical protein ABIE36_03690 [Candidatus Diapherotrites archaeon]
MSLQNLLDPEIIGSVLIGAVFFNYVDSRYYTLFKDTLSFSKDVFKNAEFYSDNMNKFLSEEKLSDDKRKLLNLLKQTTIERYESFQDKSVPKFFLFSRTLFYFQAKKEFSYMKKESKRRLNELRAA